MVKYQHEIVDIKLNQPAKLYYQHFPFNRPMKPHWHDEIEIVLPIHGHFIGYIEGEKQVVEEGKVFLINSQAIHYMEFPDPDAGADVITILLSVRQLKEYLKNYDHYDFKLPKNQEKKQVLIDTINAIYQIWIHKDPYYEPLLHAKIHTLYYYLLNDCRYEKRTLSDKQTPLTKKIIDYIDTYYQQPLTLDFLAETFGYSNVYLSRIFKENCHLNLLTYIQKVRLSHAYDQLIETELSVLDIALDNGFPNVRSFIDTFKKYYGTTPAKYRKEVKNQL